MDTDGYLEEIFPQVLGKKIPRKGLGMHTCHGTCEYIHTCAHKMNK